MLKIILGVIVGFVVWSILWVGCDSVIRVISPGIAPSKDLSDIPTVYLAVKLILSVIFSIISGFIAALIAKENAKSTLILGVLLLLVGIMVEVSIWNLLPVWFHLAFLILLIPMTVFGGRMRTEK
jgi:Ni,Fe-hydrogenase I cytochrome b subunit